MPPWQTPASEATKTALIHEKWGDDVPDYLWYELGDIRSVDIPPLVEVCFPGSKPGFGDIEVHKSSVLSTADRAVYVLRVRNPTRMPMSIVVHGRTCMLYMVGHSSDDRSINFAQVRQDLFS